MKKTLSLFLTLCSLFLPISLVGETSPIEAQSTSASLPNVGFAAFNLTAPSFNCSAFVKASSDLPELHVAFLYNTFGNDFSCLNRILRDPRLKTLEVALINEPGHRNARLGPYEFLSNEGSVFLWDEKLRRRDKRLKAKFNKYVQPLKRVLNENLQEHTSLIVNPGLESNVSDRAGRVLIAWTREEFPNSRVVWNPLKPSPARRKNTRADFIEGHNLSPNIAEPCIYNMDGTDVSFPDRPAIGERNYEEGQVKNWVQSGTPLFQLIEQFANRCEVAFVWTAESNGINERATSFVDPRKRNHRISIDRYNAIFSEIRRVQSRGRVYPTEFKYTDSDKHVESSCDVVRSIFEDGEKKGNLLKQSEFRDRGGVLILSNTFGFVRDVKLIKGRRVVDEFDSSGKYKDGRLLFRSSRSPTTYPFNTYLTFSHNNQKICYKLPNPRVRLD